MKKKLAILLSCALLIGLCACTAPQAAAPSNTELEAQGWVKNPSQSGWVKDPAANGWVKEVDAVSQPTAADAITGASTVVDPAKQLTQEQIRELALDYLRGWELAKDDKGETIWSYREMYQIATSHNNKPGLSSVEFVIDPVTMKLYASSEKGTEKCEHIKVNPDVVLYWYKQIPEEEYVPQGNDYFNSWGVQIKGTARMLTLDEPGAKEAASLYMSTLYGAEKWEGMPQEQRDGILVKLFDYNDWIEIDPDEYIVNSLNWSYNKEESSRPEWYNPDDISFGKSVRQVYQVK